MITGSLAGLVVAVALASLRMRPDHRLRDTSPPHPRGGRKRRTIAPRSPDELATWCDSLARDVRAGSSLVAGLRTRPAPSGSPLGEIARRLERGVPVAEAVVVESTRSDEQAVVTVLAACARHGGPAAQPLDRVAATLRQRAADAAEREVHSASARASATVMTVLPVAILALLLVTSPSIRSAVAAPLGGLVVTLGLVLNGIGWRWMRRLVAGGRR